MQAPASARRELDAEWPLQPRAQQPPPLHESAAPLGQRSAGATAEASALSNGLGGGARGGALAAGSASTQEAVEQGHWSGRPLNPETEPSRGTTRAAQWRGGPMRPAALQRVVHTLKAL